MPDTYRLIPNYKGYTDDVAVEKNGEVVNRFLGPDAETEAAAWLDRVDPARRRRTKS